MNVDDESEQMIIKQAIRFNDKKTLERKADFPELRPGLELYLKAFLDLDTERSHGMGLTSIPWSSIRDYAKYYSFDERQTDELFYHIRSMDEENLKRLDEKIKSKQK